MAFALFGATAALLAQSTVPGPGGLPPLEKYLEALREQAGIPGMSGAIVQDGQIVWEYGFGFQNVASRIRATPDTPYQVGDLTGPLTATLLLQCVEQRHLDLDVPVSRYGLRLPDSSTTLSQVLSHTSDGAFLYNPDRYAQLTSVMEFCAPQPFRKSIDHRILNRLAMRDSVPGTDWKDPNLVPSELFDPSDVDRYRQVLDRMAIGYKVDLRGRPEVANLPPAGINAATGLVSTVRDLAQFEMTLDSDADVLTPDHSTILLTPDTLARAWNPVTASDGTTSPMGLGWFVQTYRGERVVWHFGLVPNAYSALIVKLPARHITFILLANSDRLSSPFQLAAGDVTRSVFATLFLKRTTCPLASVC
jgi:CubicO group peptidase (beta-lactamase class C family)